MGLFYIQKPEKRTPPPPPRPKPPRPDAKKKKHQDRPENGSSRLEANEHNRLPQPIRGVANFLNEEGAAAREDYKTLRKLKKNPKY